MAKEKEEKKDPVPTVGGSEKAMTIEQLSIEYPDLMDEIVKNAKTEAAKEIAALTPKQFKNALPKLYGKIAAELVGDNKAAHLKVPGFLLDVDDPFALGTARCYAKIKGIGTFHLPIVLPFKDPASKEALKSYILRADGGGDRERADKAREALEKVK